MTPRRRQILDTAADLFAARGFHGVSVGDIGAAVGISGPALYKHFAGKEDILGQCLLHASERLLEGARELTEEAGGGTGRAGGVRVAGGSGGANAGDVPGVSGGGPGLAGDGGPEAVGGVGPEVDVGDVGPETASGGDRPGADVGGPNVADDGVGSEAAGNGAGRDSSSQQAVEGSDHATGTLVAATLPRNSAQVPAGDILEALIAFHTDFALSQPSLIVIQEREWGSLGEQARAQVRERQLAYIDVWTRALRPHRPDLSPAQARAAVQAAFGLLNSTPHSARISRAAMRDLLTHMARAALAT